MQKHIFKKNIHWLNISRLCGRLLIFTLTGIILFSAGLHPAQADGYSYGLQIDTAFSDGAQQDTLLQSCGYQLQDTTSKAYVQARYDDTSGTFVADGTTNEESTATTFTPGKNTANPTQIQITGLPEGDYVLRQVMTPDGYDGMKGPIYFTIQQGTFGYLEEQKKPYLEGSNARLIQLNITIQNPTYDPRNVLVDQEEPFTEEGDSILGWVIAAEAAVVALLIAFRVYAHKKESTESTSGGRRNTVRPPKNETNKEA